MRGFLIFLAIVFPIVLATPSFWSLWRMEFSAERIGYIDHAGVTQWASLGPKSGWPSWAVVPDGAKLTVRANFERAPGRSAMGYGEINGRTSARVVTEQYEAALRSSGWVVRVGRFDTRLPDEDIHWCIVEGRREQRVQRMRIDIDETRTNGQINWADGPMPYPFGAKDEPCWAT
jgi:hypothetical protein